MEDLEDTQYFYEYSLPDVLNPDSGNLSKVMKVMNMLREEGTSEILNLVTYAENVCRFFTRSYSTA